MEISFKLIKMQDNEGMTGVFSCQWGCLVNGYQSEQPRYWEVGQA